MRVRGLTLLASLAVVVSSTTTASCEATTRCARLSPCEMGCLTANCAAQSVCPFYRPAGWCAATNASGDERTAFGDVDTVDGAAPPPMHETIAIARDPWVLFGTTTTLRAFSVAHADDGRIALACTPGKGTPVHEYGWPYARNTDPPEWDPPKRDAPGVTGCEAEQGAWSYVVVRHERSDVVRYFTITEVD